MTNHPDASPATTPAPSPAPVAAAALPATMRAIDHGAGGDADVIRLAEGPLPVAGPGQLLVRVAFAGVNRPDVMQRAGLYPAPRGASPVMGLEVAGEVVAIGEGVEGFALGDAVCALCNGGGYAEYAAVPAGQALPVPRGFTLAQAAALPENWFTVWHNIAERGRLAAGETLLVHGGSSGIGLSAIRLGKRLGATVLCTVGSADKAAACLADGADAAIDYRQQDFVDEVARLTGKRGVDVILDMVGGDYVGRNLRCLADDGRLVQIAFQQGSKVEVDWMRLMMRRLTFTGSTLRARTDEAKAGIAAALRREIWPGFEDGSIRAPRIDSTFPLARAADAHRRMESSAHVGKILLEA